MRSPPPSSSGRATASPPTRARGWSRPAGSRSITAMRKRARFDASLGEIAERLEAAARDDRRRRRGERRRRSAAADLHLLPPGADAGRADRAHAARGVRPDDRRDRERVLHLALDRRAAHRPRQGEDSRRRRSRIRCRRWPSLADRLDSVLHVIYLVFNEGYFASSGESLTRHDLSGEAIRLGRLLIELLPEPEAIGLLALMLLHESRRAARTSADGELILLADQDRDRAGIAIRSRKERRWSSARLTLRRLGPYTLQAAIAAVHAEARDGGGDRLGADRRACTTCSCAPIRRRWSS